MPRRLLSPGAVATLAALCTFGCGDETPDREPGAATDSSEAAGEGPIGPSSDQDLTGRLTIEGQTLAAPGAYRLLTSCSYSRETGTFSLGLRPAGETPVEPGPALLGIRAGGGPNRSIPLTAGSYEAEFEYEELAGDGTVASFFGTSEVTLRIVDRSRPGFPVLEVEATGRGDGIRLELAGRCRAVVHG